MHSSWPVELMLMHARSALRLTRKACTHGSLFAYLCRGNVSFVSSCSSAAKKGLLQITDQKKHAIQPYPPASSNCSSASSNWSSSSAI